jgi:hypothetical protein
MSTWLRFILSCTPTNVSVPPLRPKALRFRCSRRLAQQGLVDNAWSIAADRLFCLAAAFFGRAGLIWINVARGKQMAQN